MLGKILAYMAVLGLLAALIGGAAYILWHPQEVEARGIPGGTTSGAYAGGRYGQSGNVERGAAAAPGAGVHTETPLWESLPLSDLSADEQAALIYMREEEKLARDVYLTLYETWGIESFNTIAQSEQTHMDTVLGLLERYGLQDPVADKGVGEFANPTLAALYTQLVAQGQTSAVEALKVGAYIEELDIADLQTRLAQTDNADIQQVFNSLQSGSVNHLRAFTRMLDWQFGVTYTPQVLDATTYQSLVGSSTTPGATQTRGRGRWNR